MKTVESVVDATLRQPPITALQSLLTSAKSHRAHQHHHGNFSLFFLCFLICQKNTTGPQILLNFDQKGLFLTDSHFILFFSLFLATPILKPFKQS
jgi:hypothetical protein